MNYEMRVCVQPGRLTAKCVAHGHTHEIKGAMDGEVLRTIGTSRYTKLVQPGDVFCVKVIKRTYRVILTDKIVSFSPKKIKKTRSEIGIEMLRSLNEMEIKATVLQQILTT